MTFPSACNRLFNGKRVVALCGITGDGYEKCLENGIDEIYAIADPTKTLEENIERETAIKNIERKAFEVFSKILKSDRSHVVL